MLNSSLDPNPDRGGAAKNRIDHHVREKATDQIRDPTREANPSNERHKIVVVDRVKGLASVDEEGVELFLGL